LGSLRSLQCGHSGKMVCETQWQSSDLEHRNAPGEAPVSCPKSVGSGHPNTPERLLQHILTCSYFAVLSFVLIRSNHHISISHYGCALTGVGTDHGCSPPARSPGVQKTLELFTQSEDQCQGDTFWSSTQLWPLSACETRSHSSESISFMGRLEMGWRKVLSPAKHQHIFAFVENTGLFSWQTIPSD